MSKRKTNNAKAPEEPQTTAAAQADTQPAGDPPAEAAGEGVEGGETAGAADDAAGLAGEAAAVDGGFDQIGDAPVSAGLRFTKRPVTIEAWKFVLPAEPGLKMSTPLWLDEAFDNGVAWIQGGDQTYLIINTLEGDHRADPGDFIIRGVKGELYPCKPDIFELTYVPADETEEPAINEAPTEGQIAAAAEPPAREPRHPLAALDPNLLTAMFAASGTFGTKRNADLTMNLDWLQTSVADCVSALGIAAAFLRANREATPETLTIQLRLKGVRGAPAPAGLVEIAWRVFAFTLNTLDAHDQAEADAQAVAAKAEEASRPRGAMPGQLKARPASRNLLQPTQIARVHGRKKPGK